MQETRCNSFVLSHIKAELLYTLTHMCAMLNRTAYDRFAHRLTEQRPTGFDFIFISRNVEQSVRGSQGTVCEYMNMINCEQFPQTHGNNSMYYMKEAVFKTRKMYIQTILSYHPFETVQAAHL